MRRHHGTILALLICFLFLALGSPWLDDLGLQTDEAIFAGGLYPPYFDDSAVTLFGHPLPLMLMSYVGALKGWLYAPIFAVIPVSTFAVRFVSLLIGAATVWIFYCLVRRLLGTWPALAAAGLLATDPMFILTIRWDWGPVAIQHLCLVSACLSLVKFNKTRTRAYLACGFLFLGLGLWDKALFGWAMTGLTVAAALVCRREIGAVLNLKSAAIACAAFILGCFPLLFYNMTHNFETFRSNAAWSAEGIGKKLRIAKATFDGSGLFGSIVREPWDGPPRPPVTTAQGSCVLLNRAAGSPRKSLQWCAFLTALGAVPLLAGPHRRTVLFAVVFLPVAWAMMAFTRNAGGSVHHTILLWPMPQIVLASLIALPARWPRAYVAVASILFMAAVIAGNLLVLSTYYTYEIQQGGTVAWTDAFPKLSRQLSATGSDPVYLLDWGFADNLKLLHKGKLQLRFFSPPHTHDELAYMRSELANPRIVYVTHTAHNRFFQDTSQFLAFAAREGYRKQESKMFSDGNGRPVIEMFKVAGPAH